MSENHLAGVVWSNLSVHDRKLLIFAARPEILEGIAQAEARRWWPALQPTLQEALERISWNEVLGRDVAL